MIKIGIIGYGYWGPNLVRNFLNVNGGTVVSVAENREARIKHLLGLYPGIRVYNDGSELISDPDVDAIVIATPVFSHYDLAKQALLKGKHVLIEKPMTASVTEAQELIEIAARNNLVLMVDHTFLYTGAVQKIHQLIKSSEIGELRYFDSIRINLGLFQPDVNVLWDLAPHDISILTFLCDEQPVSVNATGTCHTNNGIENIAYLTLNYQSDFIAHVNCSWTSPVKVRQTLIGGSDRMVMYNDLEPSDKIRIYDTSYNHQSNLDSKSILVDYRIGDVYIPKLTNLEALNGVAVDFINSIANGSEPVSNAHLGLQVVKILDAAQRSIKSNGKEITILK